MKNLRALCATTILLLALATPILAGDMEIPVAPPQSPSAPSLDSTGGDMETGNMSTDSVRQAALSLLQSMLLLF